MKVEAGIQILLEIIENSIPEFGSVAIQSLHVNAIIGDVKIAQFSRFCWLEFGHFTAWHRFACKMTKESFFR